MPQLLGHPYPLPHL